MNLQEKHLWDELKQYPIEIVDQVFPIYARLMRDHNWSKKYALSVIEEYKRLMFLQTVTGYNITPSEPIKRVWELHLMYTQSYWAEFCQGILGKLIHYNPSSNQVFVQQDVATRGHWQPIYHSYFGVYPPHQIWSITNQIAQYDYIPPKQKEIGQKETGQKKIEQKEIEQDEKHLSENEPTLVKEKDWFWWLIFLRGLMPKSKITWFLTSFISLFTILLQPNDLDFTTAVSFIAILIMIIGVCMAAINSVRY